MTDLGTRDAIDPLTALAIRHGTDKWGAHFYTPIYHKLLAHLRERPVRLLEIGIGGYHYKTVGGASLRMWADYFPHGQIVGIDVFPKTLALGPRITTFVGSQDDRSFLDRVTDAHGPFDIVIDDGSHKPEQVSASFYTLFPRLADGGLYIVEDVQTTFWPNFGGSVRDGGQTMKLIHSVVECLNHAEIRAAEPTAQLAAFANEIQSLRAYHNLIAIEKGDNSEPSNFDYRLDNPHTARAKHMIEAELSRAPRPEIHANLISVVAQGRDDARADRLIAEGLARWPDHPDILSAAILSAEMRDDLRAMLSHMERFLQLEPGNEALRAHYEAVKAKLLAQSSPR
jgi:hypothetical protein